VRRARDVWSGGARGGKSEEAVCIFSPSLGRDSLAADARRRNGSSERLKRQTMHQTPGTTSYQRYLIGHKPSNLGRLLWGTREDEYSSSHPCVPVPLVLHKNVDMSAISDPKKHASHIADRSDTRDCLANNSLIFRSLNSSRQQRDSTHCLRRQVTLLPYCTSRLVRMLPGGPPCRCNMDSCVWRLLDPDIGLVGDHFARQRLYVTCCRQRCVCMACATASTGFALGKAQVVGQRSVALRQFGRIRGQGRD
jgi:hypothetical protein